MVEQESEQNRYTMGYSDEFRQLLNRRSLESHGKHLLPHLKPGLRALDFGCGPGTITVGLARMVEPGEVHGVDMEESQIDLARAAAEAGGHGNAVFHVGNVNSLPFEDNHFDVAHCHAVLMHVPDTEAALAEVKRVLKPGGILACREAIVASCFLEPELGHVESAWTTFARLLAGNGGHPQMGKELKNYLVEAGFTDIEPSLSFDTFGTAEDQVFFHGFVSGWFFSPEVIAAATAYGLATEQQFDAWRAGMDEWKTHPGGIGAIAFGEVVARKP